MVSQTTFDVSEWKKSLEIIKKLCTNAVIFDTICNATAERQEEARSLAEKSDLMIVIGDKTVLIPVSFMTFAKGCASEPIL